MRYSFGYSVFLMGLAACSLPPLNDGGNNSDNITSDPAYLELKKQEGQPARAENPPVTVRPPTEASRDGTISNSQDFGAIKARETIASDAAKLEELKSNYEIVRPGAAPTRRSEINLAKYALAQTNQVGQKVYSRFAWRGHRAKKKCARYASADDAQTDFLKTGGPRNDIRGIDPDGDGYACNWSPAVYHSLIGQ